MVSVFLAYFLWLSLSCANFGSILKMYVVLRETNRTGNIFVHVPQGLFGIKKKEYPNHDFQKLCQHLPNVNFPWWSQEEVRWTGFQKIGIKNQCIETEPHCRLTSVCLSSLRRHTFTIVHLGAGITENYDTVMHTVVHDTHTKCILHTTDSIKQCIALPLQYNSRFTSIYGDYFWDVLQMHVSLSDIFFKVWIYVQNEY